MPAFEIAVTASIVGCASRQSSGPKTLGSQQFLGPPAGQPARLSMLSMHASALQPAFALQLGPPSVARMTNVRPERPVSVGRRSRSVSAVGVPPNGCEAVIWSIALVVGPSVPAGESPGRTLITCPPGAQES